MIEFDVRTRLLAVTAVTDIVAQRVRSVHLEQNPKLPAISMQVISGSPSYDMEGQSGVADVRLQIDCWVHRSNAADAYAQARALGEAVRGALSGYTGTVGSSTIEASFLENRTALYDDATAIYRERQEWMISYAET